MVLPAGSRVAGLIAGVAAIVAMLAAGASDARAQERRIATLAPPGSSWMKVLDKGAAAIDQATNGRVKTKYYSGGSQGDERDVVRKMRLGGIDGAALTSVGLSMIYSGIRVLELPRLFESTAEMDYVRKKMWKYFQKKFEKEGYMLGEPGDVGFIYFLSKEPVQSMSDLKKTKVWMWTDDRLVRTMFKKLDVSGVPLGVPDVLPALQTGRINAAYGSPLVAVALQWGSKVRYMTSMPMSYAIGATVLRKEIWEKSSKEDQKIQNLVSKNLGKTMRKTVRSDNKEAQKTLTRKGIKVLETPAAMVAEFDKVAQEVWQELVGSVYSRAELDMALKHRAAYRAKK
ncbi:MAG TPA: TRAP transporter substrate-binding protein DctP [Kofleriaceae bacterium]|nr:TRAP transporter substrate-binding protein DctP [Kofleriaceae bacterium]